MSDLPKRQLGRTGLEVTVLGYGAMELRGAPRGREVSEKDVEQVLNSVLDSGINYVDTSPDYGMSEERIGKYISHRRSEFYLASKCGCLVGAEPEPPPVSGERPRFPHTFTAENVVAGVEQSLRRMKTDYLDVVQFHMSPSRAKLEDQGGLNALLDLQRQGKVRFIGISGTILELPEQIAMGVFDVFQIPYSAVQREHENMITAASQAGAGVVVRGGAAKGGPSKKEGTYWDLWGRAELDDLLGDIAPMEFVLRFTCTHPDMDTTIVGTVSQDHLRDNLRAVGKGPLPADVYREARRRLDAAGLAPEA